MNSYNYILKNLYNEGILTHKPQQTLQTDFKELVDNLEKQWTNLINSSQGIKHQKYILQSIQKLQPQKTTEFFHKFINITISLITIATIGSLIMYNLLYKKKHWSSKKDLTFIDCFYYHCATLSTVGYGDLTAVSQEAKFYTIFLIIITMVELVAVIDIINI
tara:strand:- start:79 stop:564 length:486 start_codon:yes stop_codon:yes gene_type:complete